MLPSRLGFPEDRDTYRLRDRNGCPVICFRCGKSALPTAQITSNTNRPRRSTANGVVSGSEDTSWKRMLSCDFCSSSWHLDCLNPPLTTMPSLLKKWMCPNHVEQTIVSYLPESSNCPQTSDRVIDDSLDSASIRERSEILALVILD
jgi:hypothetical protein